MWACVGWLLSIGDWPMVSGDAVAMSYGRLYVRTYLVCVADFI